MSGTGTPEFSYSYLSSVGFRVFITTVSYPLEYAKFLIQIGHEPLPPYNTRSFFGKPTKAFPNVFRYVNYIKELDGISGCYRGYFPKITGQICGAFAAGAVAKKFSDADYMKSFNPMEDEMSDSEKIFILKKSLTRDLVGCTVTIAVSHPFVVISARMMAQFVGGEDLFNWFFRSIIQIYKEDGLVGFFSGIIPRWLGEVTTLVLSTFVTFALNNYLIHDKELRNYTTPTIHYIANSITYPFCVVSSCMAINNCGLAAGYPPRMPIYKNWVHCWMHLSRVGCLTRGSNLFFRYYSGSPRA